MSRVLITGGAGFVGGFFAKKLCEDGHEVEIVDNFSRGVEDDFLKELSTKISKIHSFDLLQESSWDSLGFGFDYIVHLAAIIGVKHVLERPYSVLRDNFLLTDLSLQFAKKQKSLKKYLFASTSEVMAGSLIHMDLPLPTPENFPIALTDLSSPRTSYMLSKIYGEAMCNLSGIPFVIIRPHNIYGPRMGSIHVVPELLFKAFNQEEDGILEVASLGHSRAMCFIDDAIELIESLLFNEKSVGQTYNVGNEKTEIKISELAQIIIETVGKRLELKGLPETIGSPNRRCPDMSKTISLCGFTPKVTVEEGVKRTYEWYKNNVFNNTSKTAI